MAVDARLVHTIELDTAYAVGSVNCFVLPDPPLTLIDTGGKDGQAQLEERLARIGHRLEDVELILLSHHHADHAGLANIIRERSGCVVAGHEKLVPFLTDVSLSRRIETQFHLDLLTLNGVPAEQVKRHRQWQDELIDLIDSVDLDVILSDGDEVQAGGRRLSAILRPGHSATDTLFLDSDRPEAFVGDHLLADRSADPVAWKPRDRPADARTRPSALLIYREGLRLTRELELDVLHVGHGRAVTGHTAVIDERLAAHSRHAERALRALAHGPATAYELARGIWGKLASERPFDTVSAILSSLDLLVSEGRAQPQECNGLVVFSSV